MNEKRVPVKILEELRNEIKILAAIEKITMGELLEKIYAEHKKLTSTKPKK